MDFIGQKRDGKPHFPAPIREERRKWWDRLKEGAHFVESLNKPRKDKSQEQLGAIWGLMMAGACIQLDDMGYDTSFLFNTNKPTGVRIGKEDLCRFFYSACPIYDEHGKQITLRKATTVQAAKFFDDVRNWMASQWGIYIPEPDPEWREKAKENVSLE